MYPSSDDGNGGKDSKQVDIYTHTHTHVFVSIRQIGNKYKHRLLFIHTPICSQVRLYLDGFSNKYLYRAKYRLRGGMRGWAINKVPLELTFKLQTSKNCCCDEQTGYEQSEAGRERAT